MGKQKKILLTGASGTVGQEVLKQLVQFQHYEITAFDQKTNNSKKILSPFEDRVKIIYGDITNTEEAEAACKDQDVVIHLAAIIPPLADHHPDLAHKVNVTGTKNLISGIQKHGRNTFFLYSSSISVYGDRLSNPWIKTSDPLIPSPHDHYAVTKIETEALLRNSAIDYCIFRLAAIMGTGNHKASGIMFHMPLDTAMEILTPKDTARAFVLAIEHRAELKNKIFNLGGGATCRTTYQEFLNRSFEAFGLGKADFPEHSFAEKNFHCGYYEDGDDLAEIIDFRRDTLEDYFEQLNTSVSTVKKGFTKLFRKPIKSHFLKQSEPYSAHVTKDKKMASRFFKAALLVILFFSFQQGYAQKGQLKITIPNIDKVEGKIQVSLYNSKEKFIKKGQEYKSQIKGVKSTSETFIFKDLPAGEYAVALYHDENSDGKCNTNLIGIPKEGYGFSQNFKPTLSAPKFGDTKFKLDNEAEISIKLIY